MLAFFLFLLFLGVPVAISMIICGVAGSMLLLRTPMSAFTFLTTGIFSTFTSYSTCVAPMFILMGELASESGLGTNLFGALQILVGRLKAGLASAVQVVCAIFGAICGSASATDIMMCRIAYPEMKRYNYDDSLAAGCIAAGGSLSTMIPPSVLLITYGIAVEESISRLFAGGIMTGVILMLLFIITIQIWATINPKIAPPCYSTTLRQKLQAIRQGNFLEIVLVFGISMGGMFAGWFTATEAGAIGTAGMLIVAVVFRRFSWQMMLRAAENTLIMCGFMYCLLAAATVFSKFFTLSRIPHLLGTMVTSLDLPNVAVITVISLIYLVLGCFIDALPLMLLTVPVFMPVIDAMGYSPVWFGCYMVVVIGLGAITPPVGIGCYIVSGASEVSLPVVFKGAIPFWFAFLLMTLLMAGFPSIATWLPGLIP
jgi:tripartite ATP-independent transporter DctM subunit